MKRFLSIAAFFLLLISFVSAAAQPEEPNPARIAFGDVWARANADTLEDEVPAGESTVVYMRMSNLSDDDVALTGVSTPAAGAIQLHQVMMDGDIMRMQPLTEALVIPAGETADFEMSGNHIMLLDVQPLVAGTAFPMTLSFALSDGTTFVETVGVPVLDFAALPTPIPTLAYAQVWARPTETDTTQDNEGSASGVSVVYMHLFSMGDTDDALIAASTDVATTAEIHEAIMDDDMMQMRPVEGGIALPASGEAALEPGGYHIMLMDLQRPLVEGEAFALTLTFESGTEMTIGVPVYDRMLTMLDE